MRKENEESLGRIHKSSEALNERIENIERRREDKSSNSSQREYEGYEEDEGGSRNERYRCRNLPFEGRARRNVKVCLLMKKTRGVANNVYSRKTLEKPKRR